MDKFISIKRNIFSPLMRNPQHKSHVFVKDISILPVLLFTHS